jgi:hyperosmotically inducible periplasmic protein
MTMQSPTRIAVRTLAMAAVLFSATSAVWAQQPAYQQPPSASDSSQAPAADNTKMNQQDSNRNNTAEQQKENPSDRELTQHVRKAIMQDKSLSAYAHNVKVISQNGTVTLKGPVHSDDEKQAIEAKAAEVAGKDKVVNDLTVVPNQK